MLRKSPFELETELHVPTLEESATCVNCGGGQTTILRICTRFFVGERGQTQRPPSRPASSYFLCHYDCRTITIFRVLLSKHLYKLLSWKLGNCQFYNPHPAEAIHKGVAFPTPLLESSTQSLAKQ
ncbi:hypothetical protein CDAR_16801 [Caerostris darwini]|uniref:Uncharacterized protein n=1 Tax=Caerostris darwini TaxID=1538125 RepID=A0AAV4M757_9ARAC|nr:hypothetical protein CDAR_16801 [Caerostris darwini]